jgi:hypothetical protein
MNRIQVATAGLFFAWMAHDIEELATMSDNYASRPPSARLVRHAWFTDLICQIHTDFRGVDGSLEESRDGSFVVAARG